MNCPNCHQPIGENDMFCQNCGENVIKNVNNAGQYNQYSSNRNNYNRNNNGNNTMMLIIGILLALIICVAVAFITFFVYDGKRESKATPTPMVAPEPTTQVVYVTPEPTPQIVYVTPVPQAPQAPPPVNNPAPPVVSSGYGTYYSDRYNFGCDYPAGFVVYDDNGSTLYTLRSPDGRAIQKISAKSNTGETVNSEMNAFLSMGSVEYKSSGSNYFAARVRNGSTYYYKYCKFKNGNLYWFEFSYPVSEHGVYDSYINDIYSNISIP